MIDLILEEQAGASREQLIGKYRAIKLNFSSWRFLDAIARKRTPESSVSNREEEN